MIGKLKWDSDEFDIVTGGYGKGAIPDGNSSAKVYNAVEGANLDAGFINPKTGRGWFIPLESDFNTTRHGFGIHPDGNLPGTKGCVGLQGDDIKKFWDK